MLSFARKVTNYSFARKKIPKENAKNKEKIALSCLRTIIQRLFLLFIREIQA